MSSHTQSPKAAYALKLPHSVKNAAQRLAVVDGVSLNQFIAVAVAEKIGAMESAALFLKSRAGRAKPADMLSVLRGVPHGSTPDSDQ